MSPFERLGADEPSVFLRDTYFHTAGYAAWLRIPLAKRPSWPAFRDELVKKEGRGALGLKRSGHGEAPLGPLSPNGAKVFNVYSKAVPA